MRLYHSPQVSFSHSLAAEEMEEKIRKSMFWALNVVCFSFSSYVPSNQRDSQSSELEFFFFWVYFYSLDVFSMYVSNKLQLRMTRIEIFHRVWSKFQENGGIGIVIGNQIYEARACEFQNTILYSLGPEPARMRLWTGAWFMESEEGSVIEPCSSCW